MATASKSYRVYCYDSAQAMLSAEWLDAATDEEAIAKASAAGFGSKCEIWEGSRLVAQLEGQRRTA